MTNTKFNEKHLRSSVKTLSIRICFTLSHLINGFIVTNSWTTGTQIAGLAALINATLFWLHERLWNKMQWNRKPSIRLIFSEGQIRTVGKSITWRVLITINNFLIPYILTDSWKTAALFLTIATLINIVIYYTHERIWDRVNWGKQVNAK